MKKILIIEDSKPLCKLLDRTFNKTMKVSVANTAAEGFRMFKEESPDVVLLDVVLPDDCGLEVLRKIKSADERAHVVVMTSLANMDTTIEATKAGAFAYMSKPFDTEEISYSVALALRSAELGREVADLDMDMGLDTGNGTGEFRSDAFIGKSRAVLDIFKAIAVACQTTANTLIQGETGTGKELIARAIHYNGPGRALQLVAINCSALVETLLESELFGHEKGAFTGAFAQKKGKFEVASGSTLFLDEVGEMSPAIQAKLLRVLQERTFERVGGTETISTGARVIAATNRDLESMVKDGTFREDLYYRLKVMSIEVPPLRERKEDIPLMVSHFLKKANRDIHRKVTKVPNPVMDSLVNYPWPGNVRELENVITRTVLYSTSEVFTDKYIPGLEFAGEGEKAMAVTAPASSDAGEGPRMKALREIEKEHIVKVLDSTGWNKSKSSVILGIALPTLFRKLKKYELRKPE